MIFCKLQGGLGNQLFQWAYGKSLSLKLNQPLYLDLSFLNQKIPGITKREYELHHFNNIKDTTINSLLDHNLHHLDYQKITDHNRLFTYQSIDYNKEKNYYLDGYFQNEKYFIEFAEIIRDSLQPNPILLDPLSNYISKISNSNSVSLHVRRTDYLEHGYHQPKGTDYYYEAVKKINNYDSIFIFSDDISWCKSNFKFDNMIFIENLTNIQDLYLMSLCKNNIIANSSFSWWAAWLNQNPTKTIVCPNSWFRGVEAKDLVPSDWIKI